MSEMIERIKLALRANARTGDDGGIYIDLWMDGDDIAKSVIAAMREPTEAMLAAGEKCDEGRYFTEGCAEPDKHWRAMIDAALAQKPPGG